MCRIINDFYFLLPKFIKFLNIAGIPNECTGIIAPIFFILLSLIFLDPDLEFLFMSENKTLRFKNFAAFVVALYKRGCDYIFINVKYFETNHQCICCTICKNNII